MSVSDTPEPCLIVIFGASGDLTKRKLIPSLFYLHRNRMMPERFAVLGVSRTQYSDEAFREHVQEFLFEHEKDVDREAWGRFAWHLHYHAADSTKADDFPALKERMDQLARHHKTGENVLFYLSMAPQLYDDTIVNIGATGMVTEGKSWCSINRHARPWQRIIVEKPFGNDTESGAHLNRVLGRVFEEEATYRIDHYLGKETVQNLLVLRFANTVFEPIWNRNYIDHVQVTATETVGVEGRGGYYDSPSGGALRDMVQSHLLQVMAVVAMEPPTTMNADDIRAEKSKVLKAVRPPTPDEVARMSVRGQYAAGQVAGRDIIDYRKEKGVDKDSRTDTYAAIRLDIDTWRWAGVPFYLRSGKAMARKLTEIVIYFKPTPHCLFRDQIACQKMKPNQVVINIQPDEGVLLRFEGKVPGQGMKVKSVVMDFDYVKQFRSTPPEAYATLLADAMRGDQTLYKHREEVEYAWRAVQPVLDAWTHGDGDIPRYPAGSWGPREADDMLARDGRHWHNPVESERNFEGEGI